MDKVKGFEMVEQFLDGWKADCTAWYMDQDQKMQAEKEYNKANPSEASKLYYAGYSESYHQNIIDFLNAHYEYNEENKTWKIPRTKMYAGDKDFRWEFAHNALVAIMNEENKKFREKWSHVYKLYEKAGGKYKTYADVVEKILSDEYERKYTKLVTDCQKITGDVLKADLKIGGSSNIEGFIEGSKGKAEIWSTLSGGEVQCLHLRFYCHKR